MVGARDAHDNEDRAVGMMIDARELVDVERVAGKLSRCPGLLAEELDLLRRLGDPVKPLARSVGGATAARPRIVCAVGRDLFEG